MSEPTENDTLPQEMVTIAEPVGARVRGRARTAPPCVIVLFGATGDLTHRKLVPALWEMRRDGLIPEEVEIVGFARREKSDDEFRRGLLEFLPSDGDANDVRAFLERVTYHQSEFEDPDGYRALRERLERLDRERGTRGNRLFYLATAPEYFSKVAHQLAAAGLTNGSPTAGTEEPWSRVVVEKPFGHDLPSARELNRSLLEVLDESQIYRIDHYLGKETVQNILALRFANGIFEPLWNHKYVDHVQITVSESLGVGGRGPYYDGAGALRDMVQNHMMQLLALVAMEPPASLDADAIRDEKVKVLRSLRSLDHEGVLDNTARAQYTAGEVRGKDAIGYLEEERVPRDSQTPTFVAMRLHVDNWRWAGTPFLLRHGKRLPKRLTEIAIQFHTPPMALFAESNCETTPNTLVLNIQPDEGVSLSFGSKVPGPDIRVCPVRMDFRYSRSFGVPSPDAYERLLHDALLGDSTLFTRRDEVEASWTYFDRVLEAWSRAGRSGLDAYAAGSWGPDASDRLFDGLLGGWRNGV